MGHERIVQTALPKAFSVLLIFGEERKKEADSSAGQRAHQEIKSR